MTRLRFFSEVIHDEMRGGSGWRGDGGDVIARNPPYGEILRVVVCDDAGRPRYDMPIWSEPVGAIAVPVTSDGRLVWIEQFRAVVARDDAALQYPRTDLEKLGRLSLELPRGFPHPGELPEETARREVEEETGFSAGASRRIGSCNVNTTYYPNLIPVFQVMVNDAARAARTADDDEDIRRVHRFTVAETFAKQRDGAIVCGLSQAALFAWLAFAGRSPRE